MKNIAIPCGMKPNESALSVAIEGFADSNDAEIRFTSEGSFEATTRQCQYKVKQIAGGEGQCLAVDTFNIDFGQKNGCVIRQKAIGVIALTFLIRDIEEDL